MTSEKKCEKVEKYLQPIKNALKDSNSIQFLAGINQDDQAFFGDHSLLLYYLRSEHCTQRSRHMHYRILVQGHLAPFWQSRFGGLRIEHQEAGTTLLSGFLPDQAALHGVLLQMIRLGLVLLSLETSEHAQDSDPLHFLDKNKEND